MIASKLQRGYFNCPHNLEAKAKTQTVEGEKRQKCLGSLNVQEFQKYCFTCEHYAYKHLDYSFRNF